MFSENYSDFLFLFSVGKKTSPSSTFNCGLPFGNGLQSIIEEFDMVNCE